MLDSALRAQLWGVSFIGSVEEKFARDAFVWRGVLVVASLGRWAMSLVGPCGRADRGFIGAAGEKVRWRGYRV